jgi:hypothetical protein
VVERAFAVGEEVRLTLPMTPRWTLPDPRIDAIRGCIAVERGPIVLCAESVDLPDDRHVDAVLVDHTVAPRVEDGSVVVSATLIDPPSRAWPYGDEPEVAASGPVDVPLTPYHQWGNRGPSTMRVWLPTH